jgi:alanine dehydrogenase
MTEFKQQCAQVRQELEQAYKQKMIAKIEKHKSEYAQKKEQEIRRD